MTSEGGPCGFVDTLGISIFKVTLVAYMEHSIDSTNLVISDITDTPKGSVKRLKA